MIRNSHFDNRIKLTQEILSKVARIDEFRGLWRGSLRLSPQVLGRLKASVIITSVGASTRIEGANLGDAEIARLLRGFRSRPPRGRDEQEVAGYADLLGRIFDNYQALKLSENQVLQFHRILLQFSVRDEGHRGQYKKSDNAVVMTDEQGQTVALFHPTPPHLVAPEMERVLGWTNAQLESGAVHPLLVIANFVFEFLAIHPFQDGNGRLSRALTNLLLLKAGYTYVPYVSLEEIIEERKADYYLALRATQQNHGTEQEDLSPWADYFLDVLVAQTERARKLMETDQPERLLSERQLAVYQLFDAGKELGVAEVDRLLRGRLPKPTIKQALSRLVALKLLERVGRARSTRYRKF